MLRYIPQYQLSASYPIYSMYVTVYTAVPTLSLLLTCSYARTVSHLCMNQNTHYSVWRLIINGISSSHNIIPYRCIYIATEQLHLIAVLYFSCKFSLNFFKKPKYRKYHNPYTMLLLYIVQ